MLQEHLLTQLSKFLSYVLRHRPSAIGLTLDEQGWVSVNQLLQNAAVQQPLLTREILETIVQTNAKQRFALNEDKTLVRANQGHSVNVSLGYTPQQPPGVLYHGTAKPYVASILAEGLQKQQRQHVHLSADTTTATQVGQRHGKAVVLVIDAQAMYQNGFVFFCSANGVWLTDHVPPAFIQLSSTGIKG